tara:strand:+ start:1533 stop:2261 length:729 start_codon:yes stop_codon:yes gene_type:complete
MSKKKKIIVFDLDETLGHFSQPYKFWHSLKNFLNNETLAEEFFHNFLDLFPDFLRHDIFSILTYIKRKKISGECDYVMVYTNNNGPNNWVNMIMAYIHKKLKYKLFDQIIHAFKINGKLVEICRTSYGKSYKDLLSCTKLSNNSQICFIDDQFHGEMNHENVTYINPEPYVYNLEYHNLAKKFYDENVSLFNTYNKSRKEFMKYTSALNKEKLPYLNKSKTKMNIDLLISKKILYNLKQFMN